MEDFDPTNNLIVEAAMDAGRIGMQYFQNPVTDIWYKKGNSPVSEADKAIDEYLKNRLLVAKPYYGWLSEETEDDRERLSSERVFIVDPIDGTRGFIAGSPEWCISIAIVKNGIPVEGVLHCPALEKTLYAASGKGLFVDGVCLAGRSFRDKPVVTGSKKLIEVMQNLNGFDAQIRGFIPSLAYRLSLVATGEIDGAFARPGAREWDIAAADIILSEAGCALARLDREKLVYNKSATTSPELVAAHAERMEEIFLLANSHGILQ